MTPDRNDQCQRGSDKEREKQMGTVYFVKQNTRNERKKNDLSVSKRTRDDQQRKDKQKKGKLISRNKEKELNREQKKDDRSYRTTNH